MHVHLWRMLNIFSRNDSFSVFFFFAVPYITPIRMTISPRNERIVRILHLIVQLQGHYLALDSVFFCVYGVRLTCYTISNPLFLNGIYAYGIFTRNVLRACSLAVLQIDSSPGQRSILLSLFYGWQRHHVAFVLHATQQHCSADYLRLCCI